MFYEAFPVWQKGREEEMNLSLLFKSVIKCFDSDNEKYQIRIAASCVYQLFINGKFVQAGPARCAHGYYRVDDFDITEHLNTGENAILIIVAGYNINNFYTLDQSSFLQAEIVDVNKGVVLVSTGGSNPFYIKPYSYRMQKTDKYSFQRAFTEVYNLDATYGNVFTSLSLDGFELPSQTGKKELIERRLPAYKYPEAKVTAVVGKGTVTMTKRDSYMRNRQVVNIGPMQKGFVYEDLDACLEEECQDLIFTCNMLDNVLYSGKDTLNHNETILYALDKEKTGFIYADITCNEDAIVYIMFDERLNDNNDVTGLVNSCTNTIKLNLKKGQYRFLSFEPYGLKYIKFSCLEGSVDVSDVHIKEYICSVPLLELENIIDKELIKDPEIKEVLDAAVNTYCQNAVDVFMDCPTRERAGWLCDSFFTARAEKAITGKNLIEYNFLENLLLPEKFECIPNGMLPMCYPSDHYDHVFISNWAMWFVQELYDFSKRNSDDIKAMELVSNLRSRVYALLKYFERFENEYGLLEKLESWVFVEWSRANDFVQDVNYPSNMLYASTIIAAGRMYGDDSLIERGEKLIEVIRERSFDGEFFNDNDIRVDGKLVSTKERSETCQYYAFFTEVATPETHKELWDKLVNDFGPDRLDKGLYPDIYPSNAFIGVVLRLDLLKRHGIITNLIEEVRGYFYYMAESTGTLWENLTPYASCNHGFTSYVLYLLSKNKE